MSDPTPTPSPPSPQPKSVPHSPAREISSSEILAGAKEVLIRHGDEVYRLQLTRNGKLILQK